VKTTQLYLALALTLATVSAGVAQQPPRPPQPAQGPQQPQPPQPPDDPIGRNLFAPELIMRYGQDIGLAPEQRATITKAIQEFQNKTVDLQWQMQDQTQRLASMLSTPRVDQTAALQQLDQVLNVEREVKRAHIGLLITIKNTLTADQQVRLAKLRQESGGPTPPPGPPEP
jgi:uncharacterized membrane protein